MIFADLINQLEAVCFHSIILDLYVLPLGSHRQLGQGDRPHRSERLSGICCKANLTSGTRDRRGNARLFVINILDRIDFDNA